MTDEPEAIDDSAVQRVVVWVSEEIMHGRFAPGQRIVAADLAKELNISRMPVREAFQMLAGQNVLELTKNKGAIVKRLTVKEAISFLQLAEAICCLGMRLAADKMDLPENRRIVDAAFAVIEDTYQQRLPVEFQKALHNYHTVLNLISGNEYVYKYYSQPNFYILVRLIAEQLPGHSWTRYIEHYRLIHEAVLAGNAYAATAGCVSHVQWAISRLEDKAVASQRGAARAVTRSRQA